MTHGEAWYENKLRTQREKGFKDNNYKANLPKEMEHKEAVRYYNVKLFAYWMNQLDDRLSIKRKAEIVSALMFGHTKKYEHFKELKCG